MSNTLSALNAGAAPSAPLLLATVGSVTSAGITLVLPGSTDATQKRYKHLVTGRTIAAGDLVLVAKLSGTYVVLGTIGT